jgi:very-short-patch-repair endonuclease
MEQAEENVIRRQIRRQFGIGQYAVGFYYPEKHIALEVDGDSLFHDSSVASDRTRDEYLQPLNIQVLRFTNL